MNVAPPVVLAVCFAKGSVTPASCSSMSLPKKEKKKLWFEEVLSPAPLDLPPLCLQKHSHTFFFFFLVLLEHFGLDSYQKSSSLLSFFLVGIIKECLSFCCRLFGS